MTDCHDASGSDEMTGVNDPNKYNDELQRLLSYPDTLDFSVKSCLAKYCFYFKSNNIARCQFCFKTLGPVTPDLVIEPHVCNKTANVELRADIYDYRYEYNRILSFLKSNWPKQPDERIHVGALDLVRSGFYYTGEADAARCNFCRLEVRGWERGDTAEGEHRRWNPHCPFLRSRAVGNIPLGQEDIAEHEHYVFVPVQRPNIAISGAILQSCLNLGIHQYSQARHPEFASKASRQASYRSWPSNVAQQLPQQLTDAGFYYTGTGDRVICFHCGEGLNASDGTARGCEPTFKYELHRLLSFPDVLDFSLKSHLAKRGFYFTPDNTASCYFCTKTLDPVTSDMVVEPHVCNKTENIEIPENTEDNRNVTNRILSFLESNWPIQPNEMVHVGALDLARSGFYYTGVADAARCNFCRLEVRGWQRGDTAHDEHRRWNPDCTYLRNQDCDLLQPAFPQYQNDAERRDSFRDWPSSMRTGAFIRQSNTGFFYPGKGDAVICFDCGLGIKDWHPNDVPSVVHEVWSPACTFLMRSDPEIAKMLQHFRLKKRIDVPGAANRNKMIIIPKGLQGFMSRPLTNDMFKECMIEIIAPDTTFSDANFFQTSANRGNILV